MNTLYHYLPVVVLCMAMQFANAQTSTSHQVTQANDEFSTHRTAAHAKKSSLIYRFHKKVPGTYNGYAIEIVKAKYPLERNYPLFKKFGNVHYEKLAEGGYSYCILLNFNSKKGAKQFLENVVKPKAPDARIVSYKLGVRDKK